MKKYVKKPWTYEERRILVNHYRDKTIEEILELLPGRTVNSIRKQVKYLKSRGWVI